MSDWQEQFSSEFGIHFKGSSGELQFSKKFIADLLIDQKIKILVLIAKEINIANQEGTSTSRLTSLANAVNKL